jgi:predicted amidophosphoribosyltransferase
MAACPSPIRAPAAGLFKLLPLDWIAQPPKLHPDLVAALPQGGLRGTTPLPWWAAGLYDGRLRRQLLQLRLTPNGPLVGVLVQELATGLRGGPWASPPLLVPIPSWKRRANPLPGLLVGALSWQLGWRQAPLLQRSRPVLGQHHLNRDLRWANQAGAFRCNAPMGRRPGVRPPLVLIDDILTTGATACAAATALGEQGWEVAGMACLARTPPQRRDLRSDCRENDVPG